MSTESASFIKYRKVDQCRPNADIVIFFDGSTPDVPSVEAGVIVMGGGKANVPNRGIDHNGYGTGPFRLDYNAILNGGSGVRFRCASLDLKQKLRFVPMPASPICNARNPQVYGLWLRPVESCMFIVQYDHELPIDVFYQCSTRETSCQITEALVREFNRQYPHLGVATQVNLGGTNFAVDIEVLKAGMIFDVVSHEGFSDAITVTPFHNNAFTRAKVQDWVPGIYTNVDSNLSAAELFVEERLEGGFMPAARSDMHTATTQTILQRRSLVLLFDEAIANSLAAMNKLKTILKGGGTANGPYLAKTIVDDCEDFNYYPYTIIRTDDGSAAALAQFKTDYPAAKQVWVIAQQGGKSYYEIQTASNTPPAAKAGSGDSVFVGTANVPNIFEVSSCPPGTACADCP